MLPLRNSIAISSEPVLKLPNFNASFEVYADASAVAMDGVLVQEGHPVAFESWKLKEAEQRYFAHKKSCLMFYIAFRCGGCTYWEPSSS